MRRSEGVSQEDRQTDVAVAEEHDDGRTIERYNGVHRPCVSVGEGDGESDDQSLIVASGCPPTHQVAHAASIA